MLRRLWDAGTGDLPGRWHDIPDAGLNPLPIQRPIPVWLGGHADVVLRRAARLGDGWLPGYRTAEAAREALETLDGYLAEQGRRRADVGWSRACTTGATATGTRSARRWRAGGRPERRISV